MGVDIYPGSAGPLRFQLRARWHAGDYEGRPNRVGISGIFEESPVTQRAPILKAYKTKRGRCDKNQTQVRGHHLGSGDPMLSIRGRGGYP